jgi:flagellar basal body-associated protein FliL
MKLKLSFASFFAALVMLAIGLLFLVLTGCSSVKKSVVKKAFTTEKNENTTVEYRTKTVYTDTGSTTTYYKDSLIFKHDTVYQPIERVVSRWFKQEIKHDSFYINRTFFVKVKEVVKETEKEKKWLPWLWLMVIAVVGVCGFLAKSYFKRL